MPEWLIERGIGETRAALVEDGEIIEARVRRDGSGHFMYDPEYIPPCVQVGASDRLMYILQRLIEILDATTGGREPVHGVVEVRVSLSTTSHSRSFPFALAASTVLVIPDPDLH